MQTGSRYSNNGSAHIIVWLIAAMGIVLRTAQYSFNRSLWWDEAMVALNILARSYRELLQPLDYFQAAPIGFLWTEKLATSTFGSGEYALRLYPFLAGVAAMLLFAWLALRLLPLFEAAIITAAFALSDPLIFYSAEVKQYSADVLATLVVYHVTLGQVRRPLTVTSAAGLAVLGVVLIWVSHAAIFVLAASSLAMLIAWQRSPRRSRTQLLGWLTVSASWAISFSVYYWTSLRDLGRVDYLLAYWRDQGAFAPSDGAVSNLDWLGGAYLRFFTNPVGLWLPSLAAALFLLGCITLILATFHGSGEENEGDNDPSIALALLLTPILLVLAASWLGRYPFRDRLILHLVPAALLLIGFGLLRLRSIGGRYGYWIAGAAALILLAQPMLIAGHALLSPRTGQEFRSAFKIMNPQLQDGDAVYIYERAGPQALYYLDYQDMRSENPTVRYLFGTSRQGKWENHQAELDTLFGQHRIWVIFPSSFHVRDGLEYLGREGEMLNAYEAPGVEVLLYDLSSN